MALLLVDRGDFVTNNRDVSDTVYDTVLNMHIQDAQFSDIQRLLGVELYNDLLRNSTSTEYQTLLNGGDYTYQDTTYTNVGLKSVIVYYAWARYVMFGSVKDTPFGFVEKLNAGQSESADINLKRSMRKENETLGFNHWENVEDFLNRNAETYPLWKNTCVSQNRSRMTIYKVSGKQRARRSVASRFRNH